MNERNFNIGNIVYHITPESPRGIILNAFYDLAHNKWTYLVSFGPNFTDKVYEEIELSTRCIFV